MVQALVIQERQQLRGMKALTFQTVVCQVFNEHIGQTKGITMYLLCCRVFGKKRIDSLKVVEWYFTKLKVGAALRYLRVKGICCTFWKDVEGERYYYVVNSPQCFTEYKEYSVMRRKALVRLENTVQDFIQKKKYLQIPTTEAALYKVKKV